MGRSPASSRPVVAAATTAALSLGLLALAVPLGWLGPDVDRGAGFCEVSDGPLAQPVNTLSNLGFVVAGLLIARHVARGEAGPTRLPTTYACLVVLLGPGSMAMHATESAAGGELDVLSMYLVSSFALAQAVTRSSRTAAAVFTVALVAQVALNRAHLEVPVVHEAGNAAFGATLLVAVALEARHGTRWLAAAGGSLVVAFAVWNTAQTGSALCFPHSLYQGHGVWHVLCAVAAYCLFRHYAAGGAVSSPPGRVPPSRASAARA